MTLSSMSRGHCPRIVDQDSIIVSNPERSQAFYGKVNSSGTVFIINSQDTFRLYVNLLFPAYQAIPEQLSVRISTRSSDYLLDTTLRVNARESRIFYEKFFGDHYMIGPQYGKFDSITKQNTGLIVPPGIYFISLSNNVPGAKYILAIGDTEKWPLNEILNAIYLLPQVKSFFNKPWWKVIETPYLALLLIIILSVLVLLIHFLKKSFH